MVDWNVLMDRFPDGVFTIGESLQIEFCNDSLGRLTGHSAPELVGAPLTTLASERVLRRRDDGTETTLLAHVEALLATSAAELARLDAVRFIGPIKHRSGVEIEVGWLVLGIASSADERPGAPRAVVSLHGLEESIRFGEPAGPDTSSNERVHQIIFENAPVGIYHFDDRGVVTACNDLFVSIIGSSRRHLVGLDSRTLPSVEIQQCIADVLAGRHASFTGDYHSATAKKTTPVAADFAPIFTRDGRVSGGVGLIRDITEQRSAERMLARAERMASLGTLAAGMVHEIQNPLAFTVTSLDIAGRLLDGPLGAAQTAELKTALQAAREGALRVSNIARDLKTFARADDERRADVDVERALESALKLVRAQISARARLDRRYEPVPSVRANEHRLVQLFVNLLVNAVEAIDDGDKDANRISVATKLTGDGQVRVEIEDSGRGMPTNERGRVFEPFWTDKPTGMGLGLAICHGIVASLGGEIFHETPSGARGTRMVITLPPTNGAKSAAPSGRGVTGAPPPRPTDEGAAKAPPEPHRGRVLVIDDEERLAATIRMALAPSHDVEVATSGRAGIEKLLAADYDVVLCDLFLPDVAGPDIYERIVVERPAVAPRFVFLTGGAFTDRARQFLQEVPNPRLEKPFDLGTLESLVAARVAASFAQRSFA